MESVIVDIDHPVTDIVDPSKLGVIYTNSRTNPEQVFRELVPLLQQWRIELVYVRRLGEMTVPPWVDGLEDVECIRVQ